MNRLIILIVINSIISPIYCQTNDSISRKLTEELNKIYSKKYINGFSVAIVNQDGILYEKGFGYSDIKGNKRYTKNTIQNIGSISKTFIGITLLKVQELGKLNLDDPVNKYLPFDVTNPYFPNESITIRQLATHTSSIRDPSRYDNNGYILKQKDNGKSKVNGNFRSPNEMMSKAKFLENILSKGEKWYKKSNFLKTKPGAIFKYSNVAAGLATLVIENATNQSFNEFTNEHIFKPLRMSNTGWSFAEVDFSKHSKLYVNEETELAFYQLVNYPDGGLITSSTDLGKYLTELIEGYNGNGKILNKQSYDELFRPQLTDIHYTERNKSPYNDEYNMGIFMGISASGQIGHTGGDPGIATHMFFNTKTKIGKLLIVNTELKKEGIKEFIDIWRKLEEYEIKL
ncbi:hypothetical protein ATO12_09230 [Aquimarina atlantica]|uniref:Beta-lactamase-related domain-containing protein n=1 Tax=Aquimarina atlantica TaxID=1317122 RepID=A0A023BY22_9FLAO|nr:serine hydrolase domain-containing protein [Aquimarina atlantica]EZH74905.1 hypothetical protein ATO12_09230 [Aquimarina atlantica]